MKISSPNLSCLAFAALTALAQTPASAGPIDPPPGPVAPTHKTLTELEPRTPINAANTPGDATNLFRITQPGSYYLTGNITGQAGKNGIDIAASNVTLDLTGFTVRGVASSLSGIVSNGSYDNITVRNGIITGWPSDGIDLGPSGAGIGSLIESIQSTTNGSIGIRARPHSIIRSCRVANNGSSGIIAPINSLVETCTALSNFGNGIAVGDGGSVAGCTAQDNRTIGIAAGDGGSVAGCTAQDNGTVGILVDNGGSVRASTVVANRDGIYAGYGSSIIDCVARLNTAFGISASAGSIVTNCTAMLNVGNGFSLLGASAFDCRSNQNSGNGFSADLGTILSRCTAERNSLDGITLASNCLAIDCSTRFNGLGGMGAGILVTGSDNRVEGNNHTANDFGIHVTGLGNLILRNSCSGNTANNYVIAANNRYGPIVDITAAGTPAALGNTAADTTTTTHPWANFAN